MNRLLTLAALAALVCSAAACGTRATLPAASIAPSVRVVAFDGSDWHATDIAVDVSAEGAQDYAVNVTSIATAPAQSVLLEVQFDAGLSATVVSADAHFQTSGAVSLLATGKPGVAGVGLLLPAGQSVPAGPLLSLRLSPTGLARSSSALPASKFTAISTLTATLDAGNVRVDWPYMNSGDCDQNSEVNVADITPLASRLHQRTDDGVQDDSDVVLDLDGNGEINLADLSVIGQNYHGSVASYNVYRQDGIDLDNVTKMTSVDFPNGTPNPHTRRTFSVSLTPLQYGATAGGSLLVKPTDAAGGAGTEGLHSNPVPFEFTAPPPPSKFEVPPAGQQEPDATASLSASMVVMPAISGVSDAGAPVIVYLKGTTLTLAYYNSGAWVTTDISAGVAYTNPQAVFTGTAGYVVAFDTAAQKVMALPFDNLWVSSGPPGRAYTAAAGEVCTNIDADYDATNDKLGAVSAYTTTLGQHVVYSELSAGTWTSSDIYTGNGQPTEILGGVSFRFDPQGGQPWCVYTAGTSNIDLTTTTFQITTTLNLGRYDGATWTVTPVTYPDSPLTVDLGFDATGTARLAMNAARNYHLVIPTIGTYDLSVLLDGTVGTYNGTTFAFPANPLFKSTATFGLVGGFPPTGFSITLNLATSASLAGPSGVCFGENTGELDFDLNFTPTGGNLAPATGFYTESGGTWTVSPFYAGSSGRGYSWGDSGTKLSTAYLQGVTLDSTNLGQVTSGIASNLEYWSP